jgi:transcriptional regulator with XRE-family HTH domain
MILAYNIQLIRKWLRDSQESFGGRFGVGRSAVWKWEQGESEPPVAVMVWLCEEIGVSLIDLVRVKLVEKDLGKKPMPVNRESAIENLQSDGLYDLRVLVEKVREMDAKYKELDENSVRKMDLMGLVVHLIERLEAGLDEKDYKAEKEAFIGRLAALLDGAGKR